MMNFNFGNKVEEDVCLTCLYLPTRLFRHYWSLTQYARCSNLKLLKQVQDSVTCVSSVEVLVKDNLREIKR